jgi:cytochrome P450
MEVKLSEELQGSNPETFDAFRHLKRGIPATKVERAFLSFGLGKHACPGRWLAVHNVKVFMSKIIREFDVHTVDGRRPPNVVILGNGLPGRHPLIFKKKI